MGRQRLDPNSPIARRRRQFNEMLRRLKLEEPFRMLPVGNLDVLFEGSSPMPEVELPPPDERTPADEMIASEIRKAIEQGEFKLPRHGTPISFKHFFGPYLRLCRLVRGIQRFGSEEPGLKALIEFLGVDETEARLFAVLRVWHVVVDVLIRYTRFDESMPTFSMDQQDTDAGRTVYVIRLRRCQPITSHVHVDGKRRKVWQCMGQPMAMGRFGEQPLDRIAWRPADHGFDSSLESAPVLVQGHALDEFDKRVGITDDSTILFDWIVVALRKPDVRKRNGTSLFVSFQFTKYRLGYFVVLWTGSEFLVRTFLFLTMDKTPEGDLLQRLFRTNRTGVEIMELDNLRAFLGTDVSEDPELASQLREAGCGHLLDLATNMQQDYPKSPLADQIRLYLGRPRSRDMQA
jgi:hypothetical protein